MMSFPRGDDVEPMAFHDPQGVIAKPIMEGRLIAFEDLVDPELLDAFGPAEWRCSSEELAVASA